MTASILMACSAAILFALGSLHLLYTFHGTKLTPHDPALRSAMEAGRPVISRDTTMWKAWVGFNASHSLGALLFGAVWGQLALAHPDWLFGSPFLLAVGFAMLSGLLVLGKAYWFRIPFTGIALAWVCYLAALLAKGWVA